MQIINYVSKGTIDEGMLSVLALKRSLSAGILDGGSGEISLGGTRLSRFMKDVENVTGQMGRGEALAPAEEAANVVAAPAEMQETAAPARMGDAAAASEPQVEAVESAARAASPDPWAGLLQVGVQLLWALSAPSASPAAAHPWIEYDTATGGRSLKLPVPSPETANRLADALSAFSDVCGVAPPAGLPAGDG